MTDHLHGKGYDKWFTDLRITDAPLTRKGLSEALAFFHERMPTLDRRMMLSFLRGMDLHKPVRRIFLEPNAQIAAFRRSTESPLKLFYTKVGANVHTLGVNPKDRSFQRFRTRSRVEALESYATAICDSWSECLPIGVFRHYLAHGGGIQYVVPESYNHLLVAG